MANRDLTKGEPGRILRAYCLPMFGSVFFQQMYNLADSFTAGRFIGEAALAAVGNSYELTLIYLAFALGCNTGASVVVARYFGAKRYDRVKTAIFTALIATGVVCAALLLAGNGAGRATFEGDSNAEQHVQRFHYLFENLYGRFAVRLLL